MAKSSLTIDITTRLETTGQLLVRSGIEIDRILSSMVQERITVTANVESGGMFLSRLMFVDPVKQCVMLAYSDNKAANSAVLAARSVMLRCNHRGAQFAFSCAGPRDAVHGGEPAIQGNYPSAMVARQSRHPVSRAQVPAEADLRCQLRMGLISFEARLVDLALDGRAFLLADDAMPICAGTRLEGARIFLPKRGPVEVAIEVSNVIPVSFPKGRRATRIACRIVASRVDLDELIRLFIVDL